MIEKGTYVALANANAKAIQGLAPKVSCLSIYPSFELLALEFLC